MKTLYSTGDVVKLKVPMLDNPAGTLGICYEEYNIGNDHPGSSFIFENGSYDGFSLEEQVEFLENAAHDASLENYIFTNVGQLISDFRNGLFRETFKNWRELPHE